jgi:DNA-binding transcriptional LysR family regulator
VFAAAISGFRDVEPPAVLRESEGDGLTIRAICRTTRETRRNGMRQLEWSDLKFFLELVRAGSPASAGRRLRADHTTVRRRVAALESALQARLFAARGPSYNLTSEGEQLLGYAEAIETLTIRAEEEIGKRDLALSGTVRIGAPDGFGALFLASRLATLSEASPDLQVQLVVLPRVVNLSNREADIAIGYSPPNQDRQIVRRLTNYRLRLYASPAYLAAHPPIETLEDLTRHRLLGYIREMLFEAELDVIPTIGGGVGTSFESTSIVAQLEAAAGGMGVCVLPDFVAASDARLTPVLPDSFSLMRQFWLIIHPEMINLARVRAVINFLTELVRSERALFHGSPTDED